MLTIEQRGAAIGEKARDDAVARLAARIAGEVPGATVASDRDGITVTGRGILSNPGLTWIGSLVR